MLFLMNDVVINLNAGPPLPPLEVRRFVAVSRTYVARLGCEAFAAAPRLQHTDPEKARRLAFLIMAKDPQVNAALFVAQAEFCKPEQVLYRYAELSFDILAQLQSRQDAGGLDTVVADREVWKRLAA